MSDESEETRELCQREGIEKVPHFNFYKAMEKVHEEEGIRPKQLMGDVLYYGDNHSLVEQLHNREDVEAWMERSRAEGKMVVLDVGLKHCGPCVKVYPTVIKLSRSMADMVLFAHLNEGREQQLHAVPEGHGGGVSAHLPVQPQGEDLWLVHRLRQGGAHQRDPQISRCLHHLN